jgi:hypothetical protein
MFERKWKEKDILRHNGVPIIRIRMHTRYDTFVEFINSPIAAFKRWRSERAAVRRCLAKDAELRKGDRHA